MTKNEKKRLGKLVDAVSGILGNNHKARKLKKGKHLEAFIASLVEKRLEIEREITRRRKKGKGTDELTEKSRSLHKQIKKAKKLRADLS